MGRIVHFEIPTDDVERSIEFYQHIFGWKIQKVEGMDYWLVETGNKEEPGVNGAIAPRSENLHNVVNTIQVENINDTMEAIRKHGGRVLTEVMDIPNVGKFVYFKDNDGNTMGALEGSM
jgi:uncharacterized protein